MSPSPACASSTASRTRWLHAHEIGQIAGRAGRYIARRHLRRHRRGRRSWTRTWSSRSSEHRFDPVQAAEWRNARLDFDTLPDLLRSLVADAQVARPEADRRGAGRDPAASGHAGRRGQAHRPLARDHHAAVGSLPAARLPQDHAGRARAAVARRLPRPDRQARPPARRLDRAPVRRARPRRRRDRPALGPARRRPHPVLHRQPARLAGRDPRRWRDRTRALEDRLSDTLHETPDGPVRRPPDQRPDARPARPRGHAWPRSRTTAPSPSRARPSAIWKASASPPPPGGSALEDRTLQAAAQRAVGPEIARRLGKLAAEPTTPSPSRPTATCCGAAPWPAKITNGDPFSPRVRLIGDLGPQAARDRAQRRIEALLASEAGRALRDLRRLKQAVESGAAEGPAARHRLPPAGGRRRHRPPRGRARPRRPQPGRAPHDQDLRHPCRDPFRLAARRPQSPRPHPVPGLRRRRDSSARSRSV